MTDRPSQDAHELGEGEGQACRCQVVNDEGRFYLPPENMVDDCPMHGKAARERLEAAAADRGPFHYTYLGKRFYSLSPSPADVRLGDIAHTLALLCWFHGRCKHFYSVAEHCVHVSQQMQEQIRPPDIDPDKWGPWNMSEYQIVDCMHGLMGQASLTYLGGISDDIKALPGLRDFRLAETVVQMCVTAAFGLPDTPSDLHVLCSARMIYTEARDLKTGDIPPANVEPYDFEISPMGPMVAEAKFLDRFHELEDGLRRATGVK